MRARQADAAPNSLFANLWSTSTPKKRSTSAARLNSRMPSSRAAITVSKTLVGDEIDTPAQKAQIEIGALQHNFLVRQRVASGARSKPASGSIKIIVAAKTELQQTKLFEITVQTVGLGIDRDAIDPLQLREAARRAGSRWRSPQSAREAIPRCFWSPADSRSAFPSPRSAAAPPWLCAGPSRAPIPPG